LYSGGGIVRRNTTTDEETVDLDDMLGDENADVDNEREEPRRNMYFKVAT
jgi:hypothetical protein